MTPKSVRGVSIVMPSYNAAGWLVGTVAKIELALREANLSVKQGEIVIVDDGSSDDTKSVVQQIARTIKYPVRYVYQENSGRYLARKNGVERAKFEYIWFVDTRVHVAPSVLKYALSEIVKPGDNDVWNAHVYVQKKGNVIARFMDAITYIGWRKYFKKPRRTSYGLKDFDYYPKGTTSFLVPKALIVAAMEEFEQEEHDMQRSSDDTHLIRIIARDHQINLSPKFSCKYHARNTFKAFSRHSYHRGQVFIDGFFRPGTRFFVPIILFLALSLATALAMVSKPALIPWILGLGAAAWVAELIVALLLGVDRKDALSLFALTPLFAACYGAGLWVAFVRKLGQVTRSSKARSSIIAIGAAFVFFIGCTSFFYLGRASLECTDFLATGPGDQTGLIWMNTMVNQPLWGVTDASNAPYGENLQSPVHVTGALEYVLFWAASQIAGPVCGYNLFTSFGLVFSAMVTFLFVRWLTRRSDVAVFAGFAATFTPYLQMKTGVHPSYAFYGVFVLAIWLAISLWYRSTVVKAVALGLVVALFFYIDPYFILLGGVVAFATLLVFIGRLIYLTFRSAQDKQMCLNVIKKAKTFGRSLVIAGVVAFVCGLVPLMLTQLQFGDRISREVGSVRTDIKEEAMVYSARPFEYLLPNPNHPVLGQMTLPLPDLLTRKPHGSNPAEDTLSLSVVVMVLASLTVLLVVLYGLRGHLKVRIPCVERRYATAVAVFAVVGLVALLVSFPPRADGLIFPAELITNYIEIWRVYSRLAVIVMFALAVLAAIGLAIALRNLRPVKRWLIVGGLMIVVAFEFLTFNPFDDNRAWSYSQTHPFYSWLSRQDNVKVIAEYPLNEPGRTHVSTAYFRDQYVHRKRVINAYTAASSTTVLRNGLRDLSDVQTAPALASLGVDLVVVHTEDGKPMPVLPGLEELDWNQSSNDYDSIFPNGQLKVYKVVASRDSDGIILVPGKGFTDEVRINSTYSEAGYVFTSSASLSVFDLRNGSILQPKGSKTASMKLISDTGPESVSIRQNDDVVWSGVVTNQQQAVEVTINTGSPLRLEISPENRKQSIVVSDISM